MSKGESIGVREFARQVGCSHVNILNLIKAGRMPQNKDGTIPLRMITRMMMVSIRMALLQN